MEEQIGMAITALKAELQARYGDRLAHLVLFGSQARGDADEDSDIDVLVVLRGKVRPGEEISRTIDIVAALSLDHHVVISCAFIGLDSYQAHHSPFLRNIRREGVAV